MSYQEVFDWTSSEVVQHLQSLGLSKYGRVFMDNDINGEAFLFLTQTHLKKMGITILGHRYTILQSIEQIKQGKSAPVKPQSKNTAKTNQFSRVSKKQTNESESYSIPKGINSFKSQPQEENEIRQSNSNTSASQKRREMILKQKSSSSAYSNNDDNDFVPVNSSKANNNNSNQKRVGSRSPFIEIEGNEEEEDLYRAIPQSNSKHPSGSSIQFSNSNTGSRSTNRRITPSHTPKYLAENNSDDQDDDYYNIPTHQYGQSNRSSGKYDEDDSNSDGHSYSRQNTRQNSFSNQPNRSSSRSNKNNSSNNNYNNNNSISNSNPNFAKKTSRSSANNSGPIDQDHMEINFHPISGTGMPPPEEDEELDRVPCRYCERKCAADRVATHEKSCPMAPGKKKKHVFDSTKMRIGNTEAAQLYNESEEPKLKKKNFRAEHEKLVNTLRMARGAAPENNSYGKPAQQYEEVDERVACPICGRKFAAESAQRHITTCERMNKGKTSMRSGSSSRFGRK